MNFVNFLQQFIQLQIPQTLINGEELNGYVFAIGTSRDYLFNTVVFKDDNTEQKLLTYRDIEIDDNNREIVIDNEFITKLTRSIKSNSKRDIWKLENEDRHAMLLSIDHQEKNIFS